MLSPSCGSIQRLVLFLFYHQNICYISLSISLFRKNLPLFSYPAHLMIFSLLLLKKHFFLTGI